MVFGYARVSTSDQNLNLQIDALLKEGIETKNIFTDKISSAAEERKNLSKLLLTTDTILHIRPPHSNLFIPYALFYDQAGIMCGAEKVASPLRADVSWIVLPKKDTLTGALNDVCA